MGSYTSYCRIGEFLMNSDGLSRYSLKFDLGILICSDGKSSGTWNDDYLLINNQEVKNVKCSYCTSLKIN